MAIPKSGLYYPNKFARITILAMEEVMGKNGLNAILNMAGLAHLIDNYPVDNLEREFDFADYSSLHAALEEMYGPRGGRGLALRAGRACFKYGIKEFGTVLGIADLAFRLLPLNMKLKVGADVFSELFNKFSDQVVRQVAEGPFEGPLGIVGGHDHADFHRGRRGACRREVRRHGQKAFSKNT